MDPRVKPEGDGERVDEVWEVGAVNDETEIEVSAGNQGLAVKAKGGAADRLGHAVADLISPFSQFAGLTGDAVRNLRIYQEMAVKTALAKAYQKLIDAGVEPNEIPTKTLVAWVEGASSEDVEDKDNLTEMWANLLANASADYEDSYLHFVLLLKSMAPDEAKALSEMYANQKAVQHAFKVDHGLLQELPSYDDIIKDRATALTSKGFEEYEASFFEEDINAELLKEAAFMSEIRFTGPDGVTYLEGERFRKTYSLMFELLESKGLCASYLQERSMYKAVLKGYKTKIFRPTNLGQLFYTAVSGLQLNDDK